MQMNLVPVLVGPLRQVLGRSAPAAVRSRAFAELYQAQFGRVYAYLRYRLADPAQAEDLAAEVFVRAWEKLPELQPPGRSVGWLFTTARHLLSDHYRGHPVPLPLEALPAERQPAVGTPEERLLADEHRALLGEYLRGLGEREREVVGLRFVVGLRNREIASIIGTSEGNVAKIIHRALARLRERLRESEEHQHET